jgi:uncharacterized protein YfaS (alpha-2-macroglobulin family)/tetratricopeptide (TPR) repeat protein
MHTIAGIERLDVSMIDPDAAFDFAVRSFAKYKPLTSNIPVPLPRDLKAGVAAVTVASPAHEATTLVIQSDLDIVVRASNGETLVFAENMRTGKPWPGVRLLLSDGKSVFAEGKTADDGTYVQRHAAADQGYTLRVFAAAEGGHVASTAVSLPSGTAAVELSDRLTLATDRAEYRPGEQVHVRGCARHAEGDRLVLEPGKKLSVELLDFSDRRLRRQSVTLSALGTFACDFPLPVGMPEGKYSAVVSDEAGHHRTAEFEIASPPEEGARLVVDVPRHVYYRGETIEGAFRVVLPQDRPLSNAKVMYRLDDLPPATATTDARGEARFKISTEELEGSPDRVLSASVSSRGLSAQCNLMVATRGFSIDLSTVRPVFVVGENTEVTITTVDAAKQPVAEKLHLKVTREVKSGDETRNESVEDHSLATAADGTAKLTLRLAKSGDYSIAASGSDRFGNTIEQSLKVRVSGDDDPERLLLIVDHKDFKVGDTIGAQVYWRGKPATALVTTHYDRLREHSLMELHKGSNRLVLPVNAAMAPGFTLTVAVMERRSEHAPSAVVRLKDGDHHAPDVSNRTLYAAECQFTVDPNLQVKLECHRHGDLSAKPQPGEPIDVTVTTCDALGKPLSAEVGLSVLPFDRTSDESGPHGALPRFSLGRGHDTEFRTASSIQFHYRPFHRIVAAEPAEVDASTIPRGISPQVGIDVRPAQPAAKPAPKPAAKLTVGDDSFGEPGPDNEADRKADFAALKAEIERTVKPGTSDDPFGTEAAPMARRAPTVTKSSQSAADSFAQDRDDAAEKPAPNVPLTAKGPRVSADVANVVPPTWPGYWNPSVVTGPDGRATVTVTPPLEASELTLAARAIAAGNLAGQCAEKLSLTKAITAEIHLPPAFTDGDEIEVPVVIHNNAVDNGPIEVELSMDTGGTMRNEKKTLIAKGHGRLETSFKTIAGQPQRPKMADGFLPVRPEAAFTLTVKAGGQSDIVRRSVPICPYGAAYQVKSAGAFTNDVTVTMAPSRRHWTAPTLRIAVSPSVQRALLDMLDDAATAPCTLVDSARSAGLPAAGDLMSALALAKFCPPQTAESRRLSERTLEAISVLISTQQPDGGWLIHGRPAPLSTSVAAYWSLVLADKAGYEVPRDVLDASIANIRKSLTVNADDTGVKAIVLHALALRGQGDFPLANQLLRDRKAIAPLGRAYLALALVEMDRKASAADVLKDRETSEEPNKDVDIEAQAVTAQAMLALEPASPRAKVLLDDLLARRHGLRWNPENATGPAVMAAARWLGQNPIAETPSQVSITVNGKALKTLEIDSRAPTQTIDVPMSLLVKGKQQISLHSTGQARIAYHATLTGVEPAENVAGSLAAWHIERSYEPPLMEVDDQMIPRGFSTLSGDAYAASFSNRMTQLSAARRGFVELTVYCKRMELAADDLLRPGANGDQELTIVEPLPSGATVVESSLAGPFDRAEILPGRIVFYFRHRVPNTAIRYQIEGVLTGANLVSPALLRRNGVDVPLAVTKPKSLVVLPQGAKSSDPYRLSPDELLALGNLSKRKGDAAAAMRYFGELLESWHGRRDFDLVEPAYKQTVFALMEFGMGCAAPAKLVHYCETIKEKWPQEPVTLDQLLTAAGAYREIGEVERSYMACRAAIEGSFTRESGVAGFLDSQGHFLRSVGLMERLLHDYPPEPYAADAEFGLAQRVYAKAGEQPPPAQVSPAQQPREPAMERDALIARAGTMLEAFLTGFPQDPAADQAAFAAANSQLDLKHYAAAAEMAAAAARRHPKSDLLDSYWYMLGYCDFALGKYPSAIEMCRKVAQAQHLDKETGRMLDSQNKYRAIYILGQIFQSLGQRADAIREYRRVEDRIADAKSTISYFVRKDISLPECTTLKPGAAAEVDLRYHNIATCDIKIYRVDLMKFCEAGQALGDMSKVNLSGIRPLSQAAVTLAGSGDYADRVQKLALPLKKEGAYLVVCRGDDLYASGLLLISPLEIEQRVDASTGQVRVFVKDTITGRCSAEAQVRLLPRGANVQANVVGATDLRGVFTTASQPGGATIVAMAGPGQYAYIAAPPASAAPQVNVAQTHFPDIDPTAPFSDERVAELERPIRESVPTKSWLDNGGNGSVGDFRTNLSLAITQSQAEASTRQADESVERPLPPPRPNSPTGLAGEESVSERRIRAALASPTPPMEFVETPLKNVIEYLKGKTHIEIQLDTAGLKDAGVDPETQVTKNIRGISLRSALQQMLDELQLKYVIHNEVLLITSPQKAESDEFMVTKAYPVQDLVLPSSDGTVDVKPLEDLLQNTVATKSWIDNGGNGTISEIVVGNRVLLVMSQTQEVHGELEETLAMLRKAGGVKSAARKLAEKEQSEDETDLPQRPRSPLHRQANDSNRAPFVISAVPVLDGRAPGGAGNMAGMGGMGGGMGGMGFGGQGGLRVQQQAGPGGDADLLGGLRSANAANQQSKVLILKQRQDAGQNGGAGMGGGMGGGFF